jgi:hypothetical protein
MARHPGLERLLDERLARVEQLFTLAGRATKRGTHLPGLRAGLAAATFTVLP